MRFILLFFNDLFYILISMLMLASDKIKGLGAIIPRRFSSSRTTKKRTLWVLFCLVRPEGLLAHVLCAHLWLARYASCVKNLLSCKFFRTNCNITWRFSSSRTTKKKDPLGPFLFGTPGRIRTSDRLVRSQVLYPAELRARSFIYSVF